ncbi:hypothetical protein [Helicobacter sp. 23-1045]
MILSRDSSLRDLFASRGNPYDRFCESHEKRRICERFMIFYDFFVRDSAILRKNIMFSLQF